MTAAAGSPAAFPIDWHGKFVAVSFEAMANLSNQIAELRHMPMTPLNLATVATIADAVAAVEGYELMGVVPSQIVGISFLFKRAL